MNKEDKKDVDDNEEEDEKDIDDNEEEDENRRVLGEFDKGEDEASKQVLESENQGDKASEQVPKNEDKDEASMQVPESSDEGDEANMHVPESGDKGDEANVQVLNESVDKAIQVPDKIDGRIKIPDAISTGKWFDGETRLDGVISESPKWVKHFCLKRDEYMHSVSQHRISLNNSKRLDYSVCPEKL